MQRQPVPDYAQVSDCVENDFELDHPEGEASWECSSAGSKKRKALKKAPEAPKRFKSAYICFVMQKMEGMKKAAGPEAKVTWLRFRKAFRAVLIRSFCRCYRSQTS
jgi:hypothetical protein